MSGYFGQDYFGGSSSTPTSSGGTQRTFVVNLNASVAATGTAMTGTDAAIVSQGTDALIASRTTDATLTTRTTDAGNLRWLVSP